MKTKNAIDFPVSLRELYSHPSFVRFGSSNDDWIADPERMERCYDAAEEGMEGSTHYEELQDWREFLNSLKSDALRVTLWHDRISAEIEKRADAIEEEIDACEAWHEKNGSLHEQIG